jgi:hypothetical protein
MDDSKKRLKAIPLSFSGLRWSMVGVIAGIILYAAASIDLFFGAVVSWTLFPVWIITTVVGFFLAYISAPLFIRSYPLFNRNSQLWGIAGLFLPVLNVVGMLCLIFVVY